MALPTQLVELGFDLSFSANPNLFTLDNDPKGKLDGLYGLGGLQFIDVTSRVRIINIQRGRSNLFSSFPAGQVSIELNNHDRAFDPLYSGSPYFGNIVPRRAIRVTSGGVVQFNGWIDDWNLSYLPNGDSVVSAVATDATSIIAQQTISGTTPTSELTGARINAILDRTEVNWSSELRDIDTGAQLLGNQEIQDSTNVLQYLQTVAASEPGQLFIDKAGKITFKDRGDFPTSETVTYLGGTGIPFQNIAVVYGAENLYNEVQISRLSGGTAIATDTSSQATYGIKNLTIDGLLMNSDSQLVELSLVYAQRYSEPQYNFESVEVNLDKLIDSKQAQMLALDIGSIVRIEFTPNGIGDAIVSYNRVIGVDHTINTSSHYVTLGFEALDYTALVLDDAVFGKLDSGVLSW
jgi:hypothetical protein